MTQLTKGQHYVPRAYLKNFTEEPLKRDPPFWEYDKTRNVYTYKKISNVCVENFLYDITKKEINELGQILNAEKFINHSGVILDERQPVEKFLNSFVEGFLFNNIKEIIKEFEAANQNKTTHNLIIQDDEQLYLLLMYIHIQFIRTPKEKEIMDNSDSQANKEILEILDSYKGNQAETYPLRKEIEAKSSKAYQKEKHHARIMNSKDLMGMTNILFKMYKTIFLYSEDTLFATSDNPAILDPLYRFKSNFLFFPLTPKLAVCLINEDDSVWFNKVTIGKFYKLNAIQVYLLNLLTLSHATKYIFIKKKNQNNDDIRSNLKIKEI